MLLHMGRCAHLCMHDQPEAQACVAQMALEAIYKYQMPSGQQLSAVSLSWGLDEARTDPREMKETDKWLAALLEKVWTLLAGPGGS